MLLTLHGYIQPHKTSGSNYLNTVIIILFMILLMLRADPYLQDNLESVSIQGTSIPSCDSDDMVATPLSILLATVYYSSLLVALICLVVWIVHLRSV